MVLPATGSAATDLQSLYTGEVPVIDGRSDESQLLRQAFVAMLVKLTGESDPAALPGVAGALGDAQSMLSHFGYQAYIPPPLTDANSADQPERMFSATFLPNRVDQWLQQRQLPRWSPERQPLIAWLVVDFEGQRQLLSNEHPSWQWQINQLASQRGLRLNWPAAADTLMENHVQAAWAGFHEELPEPHEGMLLAAIQPMNQGWRARWRLVLDGSTQSYLIEAPEISTVLSNGIAETARRLAQSNLITASNSMASGLRVRVSGINQSADYGRVINEFRTLSQVEDIDVIQATGDQIELRLAARAGRDWLLQALAIKRLLELSPDDDGGGMISLQLRQ
ncbi:MAG: hypothetical protein Tsb002_07040 [Wenzhouxiangellaceae bacterium]